MMPHPSLNKFVFRINGNPNNYYDKPIAILTGPGTVSAGDVESVRLKFHPMVKFFGKSSNGAFCSYDYPSLGHPDWFFSLSTSNAYLISNHQYLAHSELDMYRDVWLSQDGVINGNDNVVEAAIDWINGYTPVSENINDYLSNYKLNQNLGQKIETILEKSMPAGLHEVKFNANELSSGVYLYRIKAGEFQEVKKMILLR